MSASSAIANSKPATPSLPVAVAVDWRNVRAVNAVMRRLETVLTPDLLSNKYSGEPRYQKLNPTTGHCSVAAEALWHMLGGEASPYRDHWAYDTEAARQRQNRGEPRADSDETHHWLQQLGSKPGDRSAIYDPTAKQYEQQRYPDGRVVSEPPPYEHGIAAGFQTKVPSKRAQVVIDRLARSLLRNPLKEVGVRPDLIRDQDADPRKPFREQAYRDQQSFYHQQLTAGPMRSTHRRGADARGGRSQARTVHGRASSPAAPSYRASA